MNWLLNAWIWYLMGQGNLKWEIKSILLSLNDSCWTLFSTQLNWYFWICSWLSIDAKLPSIASTCLYPPSNTRFLTDICDGPAIASDVKIPLFNWEMSGYFFFTPQVVFSPQSAPWWSSKKSVCPFMSVTISLTIVYVQGQISPAAVVRDKVKL